MMKLYVYVEQMMNNWSDERLIVECCSFKINAQRFVAKSKTEDCPPACSLLDIPWWRWRAKSWWWSSSNFFIHFFTTNSLLVVTTFAISLPQSTLSEHFQPLSLCTCMNENISYNQGRKVAASYDSVPFLKKKIQQEYDNRKWVFYFWTDSGLLTFFFTAFFFHRRNVLNDFIWASKFTKFSHKNITFVWNVSFWRGGFCCQYTSMLSALVKYSLRPWTKSSP